jgi:D-beta-D-heptose 7-phosphate kinase/D-beta-D-heptose 1-phosphate adenosyltransferase
MRQSGPIEIEEALQRLSRIRVAVFGDVMLDRFVHGRVDRISPEAPVPVVHVHDQEERLGGAANVAANVAALGAQVAILGVVGPGEAGEALRRGLEAAGVSDELVVAQDRVTTLKTRILGGGQQITRIDRESREPLPAEARRLLHERLAKLNSYDAIIVSDYAKGVVDEEGMEILRAHRANGTIVVADPKQGDFRLYRGCTCITPNAKEASEASHLAVHDDVSAENTARALRERLELDCLLLTRGERGMTLLDGGGAHHLETHSKEVFDVTGAGDTVIATFTALLAAGTSAVGAARVANLAAGRVIRELGTAVVTAGDLVRLYAETGASRS